MEVFIRRGSTEPTCSRQVINPLLIKLNLFYRLSFAFFSVAGEMGKVAGKVVLDTIAHQSGRG